MVLHPGVAHGGEALDGLRHALGVSRDRPGGHRHPAAVSLAKELVNGDARGLAHQVVHGRPQPQRGLIAHPIEGAGADVLFNRLGWLRASTLTEPGQPCVGMDHVDRPLPGAVEVIELVSDPVQKFFGDVVDLNVGDPDGSMHGIGALPGRPYRLPGIQQKATPQGCRQKAAAGDETRLDSRTSSARKVHSQLQLFAESCERTHYRRLSSKTKRQLQKPGRRCNP